VSEVTFTGRSPHRILYVESTFTHGESKFLLRQKAIRSPGHHDLFSGDRPVFRNGFCAAA
jgi:hypothetical protein